MSLALQTGVEASGRFQEAVAGALAKRLGAHLLVVDDYLLATLASTALGESLAQNAGGVDDAAFSQPSLLAYLLSFWLGGGRLAFIWAAVRQYAESMEGASRHLGERGGAYGVQQRRPL